MFEKHTFKELENKIDEIQAFDKDFVLLKGGTYYTLVIDGVIHGYAACHSENSEYVIHRIFIEESLRYKCYGKKLVKFIKTSAAKNGYKKIVACISSSDGFFDKMGFKKVGSRNIFDGVQESKSRQKENSKIIILSILGNIVLAVTKIGSGILGKSRALLTDGMNSLSDVATSSGMLVGVYYSNQPEDEEHPFGHEKIESVIANVLGIFMILTAFELGKGSVYMLIDLYRSGVVHTIPSISTIYYGLFSALVKYFMYKYKMRVGLSTNNSALIADAKDSRNDIYSSLGTVFGILLAIFVNPIFDIILSLPIAILIMKEGFSVIFENAHLILDQQDLTFLKEVEEYIYRETEIVNVHDMRMRTSGNKIFLDMHIRVPKDMSVEVAHELSDTIENSLLVEFDNLKEVLIHIDPLI